MRMRGIKRKDGGKWKKLAGFLVLLVIFGMLLNSLKNVYQKKKMAEGALVRMEKEAETLKNRKEFLKDSLQKLTTREGVEFEIRKKLNVAEVGESVAIIVEEKIPATTQVPATSFWQKVKDFFVGLFE